MAQRSKSQEIVLATYPNAFSIRSPWGDMFYIAPWDKAIGSIGAGRTIARAWKNAAERVAGAE
jgi:hypothetical protein